MPDSEAFAAFAAFVLALLPRLLLYPGGLFAAACALGLGWVVPRLAATGQDAAPAGAPTAGAAGAAGALAWAGVALLPVPGAAPLPGAPDLLAPLGLLLGASLLLAAGHPDAAAWRREAAGRPLLLAAPLLALAALGAGGLLPPPAPGDPAGVAGLARVLAGVAYLIGFVICYGAPGAAPWAAGGAWPARAAGWLTWLGWLGVGAALGPAAAATTDAPPGAGPGLLALLAAVAAGALTTPVARGLATRGAPWGWAALAGAVLALVLGG